jgi:hypothetical protein
MALTASTVAPVETVSAASRWFVRAFLAAFFLCAILGLEAWPLTGFRLFSQLRHETRTMWVADTVSPGGEAPLWFTQLPRAYQGFSLIIWRFGRLSPASKRAACAAWLFEARRVRQGVTAIRIFRVAWRALPRRGIRSVQPPSSALAYVCR